MRMTVLFEGVVEDIIIQVSFRFNAEFERQVKHKYHQYK